MRSGLKCQPTKLADNLRVALLINVSTSAVGVSIVATIICCSSPRLEVDHSRFASARKACEAISVPCVWYI